MKIAVITRHAISNYGSLLQTYAIQNILEKMGYDCEIIDYIREDENYRNHEKTLLKQKSNWYNNPFKRFLYLALRQPESVFSGKRFEEERKKYLKMTRRYTTFSELKKNVPEADIYMTGSDQVWGPTEDGTYDSAYCLAFTSDTAKCISYAASFGRTALTEQIKQYYRKYLHRYAHITVREDSAVKLVKELGLVSEQAVDPTLLLSAQEWRRLIKNTSKKKKYVLIYQLHNDSILGEYARKVAKAKGLPLIRISTTLHQIVRPGRFVWNSTIEDFISYIDQAECVITDSFHGTVFAINLNTQFVEVLPHNGTGTRNQSILKLTKLENRVLKNPEDVSLAFDSIDFTAVNKILEKERSRSISLLEKILKE